MSEGRQLALIVVGLVALAAVGVVSATLYPEPCEGLLEAGELPLAFTDVDDALPLPDEAAASVQQVGETLGIGPWRGAVALPDDAWVASSEFGFFVLTDDDFTVLRPSMGLVSAARSRSGLDVVSAGTSLALRAPDGETGIYDGEYEQERCGDLPGDVDVLALDRGIAVLDDGRQVRGVTLSGNDLFRAPVADAAHVVDDTVVLVRRGAFELRDIRGGDVLARLDGPAAAGPVAWLGAASDQLLVGVENSVQPVVVDDVDLRSQPLVRLPFEATSDLRAVITPAGIVASGYADDGDGELVAALATNRADGFVPLPSSMSVQSLHASADGHVGVVATVSGARALLVYGRHVEE